MHRLVDGCPSAVPKPNLTTAQIGALAALTPAADPIRQRLPDAVEIYCVGGAVRDTLLGQSCIDRDYVVVGARPQDMIDAGFTPVGSDFPVFLHPIDHNEYALARTERKQGTGYKGFIFSADPDVTLSEDLQRRDLTINAMAVDSRGALTDPCNGLADLQSRTLRHVGPAFSEDPVRLLRLARFAARWPDFSIAPETLTLCRGIVDAGETQALVPERVWQELSKGLMEACPSRCFELLHSVGAWKDLTQQTHPVREITLARLDEMAQRGFTLSQRYAMLIDNMGQPLGDPALFKAPKACQEIAQLVIRQSADATAIDTLFQKESDSETATHLLKWLTQGDALRKPDRFLLLLGCLEIKGLLTRSGHEQLAQVLTYLQSSVVTTAVAQAATQAQANRHPVEQAVFDARVSLLAQYPLFAIAPHQRTNH